VAGSTSGADRGARSGRRSTISYAAMVGGSRHHPAGHAGSDGFCSR
jgi:hypothetical protein